MTLSGEQCIGAEWHQGNAGKFYAVNPCTTEIIQPAFSKASPEQVDHALQLAASAADIFRALSLDVRSQFLMRCAEEIELSSAPILNRYCLETGYTLARAKIELARTIAQLRLYANVVSQGQFLDVRIDTADPDRQPLAKPDIRSCNQSIGPVVVFGASNFPLAYSVAGGDSVSALAAGCPLIVKGHPSHPGTCELVARALVRAVKQHKLPAGVFSLLLDDGFDVGKQLVMAPQVKAVGFTGSLAGGRALFDLANSRPQPIPVFAEMGSINPVVLLPERLSASASTVAEGFVQSLTMGSGQFCVNPGLVLTVKGEASNYFYKSLAASLAQWPAGVMLNARIHMAYESGINRLKSELGAKRIASGCPLKNSTGYFAQAHVFQVPAQDFLANTGFQDEIFGPCCLIVEAESYDQLIAVAKALPGQLTASLQASEDELKNAQALMDIFTQKAGRVIVNGYPTGVEVGHSTVHGGPYPATTDARFTSVGTASIFRFLRPVAYQNCPQALLPAALKDNNPLGLRRFIDGIVTSSPI